LARAALDLAGGGSLVNVGDLDADALLLRGEHPSMRSALDAIANATTLVLATPVYRATFSGLLKLVLDQLPPDALRGVPVVLAATAGSDLHFLALDTGCRASSRASAAGPFRPWCTRHRQASSTKCRPTRPSPSSLAP
jgi:FMN reductase